MATGGKDVITQQPKSPVDVDPDVRKMIDIFAKMGVEPKADTPEELTERMMGFFKMQGKLNEEPETKLELKPPPIISSISTPTQPRQEDKVTKMMMNHPPKIPWFSDTEVKPGDVAYELWRHEVKVLFKQNYDKDAILNAVRRSLRGEAGFIAMRLDLDSSVQDILLKLDSVYGSIEKKEELLAEFYGARQREDETVSAWSCRLETILGKAIDRGIVQRKDVDAMLHSMLWTGLKTSLKDISGHKYDTIREFDGLRVALPLRMIISSGRHTSLISHRSAKLSETPQQTEIEELKGMIQQLVARMDTMEASKQQSSQWQHQQLPWQQQQDSRQQQWQQQQPQQPRSRGNSRRRGQQKNQSDNTRSQKTSNRDIQCWRCKKFGHRKSDCRVKIDHSRLDLNGHQPMKREHP